MEAGCACCSILCKHTMAVILEGSTCYFTACLVASLAKLTVACCDVEQLIDDRTHLNLASRAAFLHTARQAIEDDQTESAAFMYPLQGSGGVSGSVLYETIVEEPLRRSKQLHMHNTGTQQLSISTLQQQEQLHKAAVAPWQSK